MKYSVLIADDDESLRNLLKIYLEKEGYECILCDNGKRALEIIKSIKIDIAILDIMMPQLDGYELLREIRKLYEFPVIMLSAKTLDFEKILGLDLGADDYMTKPFNPLEVASRVKANLRRYYKYENKSEANSNRKIEYDGIIMDLPQFQTLVKGQELSLTATEFKILSLLLSSPGRIFTKSQIASHIYGEYYENDDSSVMVHISNVREKLEKMLGERPKITTVRGLGYKYEKV